MVSTSAVHKKQMATSSAGITLLAQEIKQKRDQHRSNTKEPCATLYQTKHRYAHNTTQIVAEEHRDRQRQRITNTYGHIWWQTGYILHIQRQTQRDRYSTTGEHTHRRTSIKWLGGVVVKASDMWSTGCEFNSRPCAVRFVLGWVTAYVWANDHVNQSPRSTQSSIPLG